MKLEDLMLTLKEFYELLSEKNMTDSVHNTKYVDDYSAILMRIQLLIAKMQRDRALGEF